MAVRTYGSIEYREYDKESLIPAARRKNNKVWAITKAEPHVCIKLKSVFSCIGRTETVPFEIPFSPERSADLLWFMNRYPLAISPEDQAIMENSDSDYSDMIHRMEQILVPEYVPRPVLLNPGEEARNYQLQASDYFYEIKRLLLGDEMGLGKTVTAIISLAKEGMLPAAVVMQAHLPIQWEKEIKRFTDLKVHIIEKNSMYKLPEADVYIFKYSSCSGWVDLFKEGIFKTSVFDEVQELRHKDTQKYRACKALSENSERALGLSGTPVYNYGNEIFFILDLLNPGCLGDYDDFVREWCRGSYEKKPKVYDPPALGTYLREKCLMLRRTRKDVGRELPPVNKIVHEIPYDQRGIDKAMDIAAQLALRVVKGDFFERGKAAMELDMFMRQATGMAKAVSVAAYVKMILESGMPVVLAGWHRDVYDIWMDELSEYNPVMYTGSETTAQKNRSKEKFISGESKVFIMSLRSGIGLDGLQKVCNIVVHGELDHSPKVHDQVTARVDREGLDGGCTSIYLTINWGSDPVLVERLALKSSQSHGIMDPTLASPDQYSNESFILKLAQDILTNKGIDIHVNA